MEPVQTGKATKSISGGKNRDRNAFFCVAYQELILWINFDWYGSIEKSMKSIFHALGRAKIFTEADVQLTDTVHTIPYVSVQYHMLQ